MNGMTMEGSLIFTPAQLRTGWDTQAPSQHQASQEMDEAWARIQRFRPPQPITTNRRKNMTTNTKDAERHACDSNDEYTAKILALKLANLRIVSNARKRKLLRLGERVWWWPGYGWTWAMEVSKRQRPSRTRGAP